MEKLREEGSGALTWWMTGVTTYLLLYACGRALLHDQSALEGLRKEVPTYIYDRSTFIFLTSFALDVLNMIFERHTTKMDFVLYPAFIKGMASATNMLARFGTPIIAFSTTGRYVMVQRYVCWMHTTPTILLIIRLISTSLSVREATYAILWDELMVVSGAAALLTTGWQQVFLSILTHVAFVPVIPYFCKGFYQAATSLKSGSAQGMMWGILAVNMVTWTLFAVTWNLALCNLISVQTEETLYLVCDFTAKVMFSSTLMLSSFKGMEARRETAMRNIEDSSKQKLIEELKRLLEQKERFMSSVSHELRTPLNGIIGISEGMLSGCCGIMPEQVRHQICIIRTSGARLLALINDVMDAAALRQNKLVLKQEVVVLRHVVEDVLDLTRSLINTSDVELRNTVSPRITVLGDTGRIIQILNNLLGNAAKFTKRGMIKVSARTFDAGKRVAVMVEDTGMGIAKGKLAAIFLPFEQVDMSISRKYGGFGLGLNIVQDLVKAHGGEIWAESVEGKGSTFTFTMVSAQGKMVHSLYGAPGKATQSQSSGTTSQGGDSAFEMHRSDAKKAHKSAGEIVRVRGLLKAASSEPTGSATPSTDADSVIDTHTQHRLAHSTGVPGGSNSGDSVLDESWNPEGSLSPANSGSLAPKRARVFHHQYCGRYQVMSVDDDQINQNVVCSIFNSSGFEVLPFSGGAEALHHLATCMVLPDLVLLDCMMPVMDGFEVLRRLRAMSQSMHLPVIMVSARAEEENIVMGLSSGADDYVTKPFRRAELLARARCHLGSSDTSSDRGLTSFPSSKTSSLQSSSSCGKLSVRRITAEPVVLCVDDDEVSQLLVQQLVEPENWRLIAIKTRQDAVEYISHNRKQLPDLILLDASLPDGSGFDLCRQIRERYSRSKVPIIIVSAYHNEESIVEGLNAGANDYVSKPFRRQELLARMRMHLRHSGPGGRGSVAEKERIESEGKAEAAETSTKRPHIGDKEAQNLPNMGSPAQSQVPVPQDAHVTGGDALPSSLGAGAPSGLDVDPHKQSSDQSTMELPHQSITNALSGPSLSAQTSGSPSPQAITPAHAASAPTPNGLQQQQQQQAMGEQPLATSSIPQASYLAQPAPDGALNFGLQPQQNGGWYNDVGCSSGLDPGVQGTWACAGVLLASVPRWEEFSRSVPERELGAVMQTLATAFGQMAESVGLVMLEATGRTFSAATLHQHTLLQLAQGLMDAAAEVHLPPAYQPLPLQLILHCGPVSVAAGAASGEALRVAQDLLASAPPLNIVASTSLVARLTAAGMSHPLHALPTNAEEVLWVVEVHAAASQVALTYQVNGSQAGSLDGMQHSSYSYPASASVASKTACSHNNNMLPSTLSSDSSAISGQTGIATASIGSSIPISAAPPIPGNMLYDAQSNSIILQPPAAPLYAGQPAPSNGSIHTNGSLHPGQSPESSSTMLAMPPSIQMVSSHMAGPAGVSGSGPFQSMGSGRSLQDGIMQPRAMYPNHSAPQPSFVQSPMPFVRHARASLGAMPVNMGAAGAVPMPHPFRKSLDMQHGSPAAGPMPGLGSLPLAGGHLYHPPPHPFRGSIDIQRGMGGGSSMGSVPAVSLAADLPGAMAQGTPPRVSPNPATVFSGNGNLAGGGGGMPPQSFRRSFDAGQAPLNPGSGLSAEQQLMLLRGELTLMRQQMDHLNAGEGRSAADTGSMGGLTPSGSRAQLALSPLGMDPPTTPTAGGGGQQHAATASASPPSGVGAAAAHAPSAMAVASSSPSAASVSSSGRKEKGSVSRFFSKISHANKSKK